MTLVINGLQLSHLNMNCKAGNTRITVKADSAYETRAQLQSSRDEKVSRLIRLTVVLFNILLVAPPRASSTNPLYGANEAGNPCFWRDLGGVVVGGGHRFFTAPSA
jgi:hypothetical protein